MKPVAETALGGRYRLLSRIAVGGMGEVWVAHDESLARDVAVKVLREEFAGDAGFLERFRAEARNSAQLSHPNIAQLYDYGEQDGSGYLVMELVLGEPMSDLLDRQPVLPTRRLLPILAQTARALHAAHVAGVIHRDVKPGNILLARSGRVKITDFGIATASNQIPMTATGMVMGTAQYLAPEQAIGRAATPASDIYSLGIVAYESLVGNRPFTGPTAVDIAVAHVNTPVPAMPSDVEPELAALVMRMLDKDPEVRPRSAASLARTLDGMLDRTPPGGVPMALGRHARAVDVLDDMATAAAASSAASVAAGNGRSGTAGPAAGPSPNASHPAAAAAEPAETADAAASAGRAAAALLPRTTVVPGRPLDESDHRRTAAVPPVFTPATTAPTGHPAAGREPGHGPRRTSTTTGRRWGQVSRPLVVLVLMVIFALLGALFADTLWGPSRASGPGEPGDPYQIVMVASAVPGGSGERIGPMLGQDSGRTTPGGPMTAMQTTTARDQ